MTVTLGYRLRTSTGCAETYDPFPKHKAWDFTKKGSETMGRYDDAGSAQVQDRYPLINDQPGTHLVEVLGARGGDSGSTGLPYLAADVKVLQSSSLDEGSIHSLLVSQKACKGGRTYYLQDVKQLVGGAQGHEDKNDVLGKDIDDFEGEKAKGVGAVMTLSIYAKPPNKQGKVFHGFTCTHVADSVDEI